jgi:hypothetical protein
MCLRFVFLLITRVAAGLLLSRREEMWKTAEILILRHQLSVLQRRQPRRPKLISHISPTRSPKPAAAATTTAHQPLTCGSAAEANWPNLELLPNR